MSTRLVRPSAMSPNWNRPSLLQIVSAFRAPVDCLPTDFRTSQFEPRLFRSILRSGSVDNVDTQSNQLFSAVGMLIFLEDRGLLR